MAFSEIADKLIFVQSVLGFNFQIWSWHAKNNIIWDWSQHNAESFFTKIKLKRV